MQATSYRASVLNSSLLIFVLCIAIGGCLAQTDSGIQPPASAPASTASEPSQANNASDAAQSTNTDGYDDAFYRRRYGIFAGLYIRE